MDSPHIQSVELPNIQSVRYTQSVDVLHIQSVNIRHIQSVDLTHTRSVDLPRSLSVDSAHTQSVVPPPSAAELGECASTRSMRTALHFQVASPGCLNRKADMLVGLWEKIGHRLLFFFLFSEKKSDLDL